MKVDKSMLQVIDTKVVISAKDLSELLYRKHESVINAIDIIVDTTPFDDDIINYFISKSDDVCLTSRGIEILNFNYRHIRTIFRLLKVIRDAEDIYGEKLNAAVKNSNPSKWFLPALYLAMFINSPRLRDWGFKKFGGDLPINCDKGYFS